jgi:hypothetical protein
MRQKLQADQYAFGKPNKITVLSDEDIWKGSIGDSLRFYYQSAYPILPQPEPMFDLQHRSAQDLIYDPILKQLRVLLVLTDWSDTTSGITKMAMEDLGVETINRELKEEDFIYKSGKNKWALNQLMLYIVAKDKTVMTEAVIKSFPGFTKRIHQFDEASWNATLFVGGNAVVLENKLRKDYNIDMELPEAFIQAIEKAPMLWLRMELPNSSNGLVFYKFPYRDKSQFEESYMINLSDSITRKYITSTNRGSYMKIDNVNLPTFYYQRDINGHYATELRSIWSMEKDFMGGACTVFFIHDQARNEILMINAFVYAPGHKKRDLQQKLNYLVSQVSFVD